MRKIIWLSALFGSLFPGKAMEPEDPEKYWNFNELQQPPNYRDDHDPGSTHPGLRSIVFDGVKENGVTTKVFAYIAIPDGPVPPGGFPGVVLVHGGGGTAFPWAVELWRSYGYAVIAPDWYGTRPIPRDRGLQEIGGMQKFRKPVDRARPHTYEGTIQHISNAANMVLAHSLLRSLPQVNADRTIYVGLSWGSWYGAMVTAIDPRFRGMLEIYLGNVREDDLFINGRFLHAAKVPMYYVVGTNDLNGSPESMQAGFAACGTMLRSRTMIVDLPHSHEGFRFRVCRRIADWILKGETGLPVLGPVGVGNGTMSAPVLSEGKGIRKVFLCYTVDRKEKISHKRKWQRTPAQLVDGKISAMLPNGIFQGFLAAYDEDELSDYCCGTSDVVTFRR